MILKEQKRFVKKSKKVFEKTKERLVKKCIKQFQKKLKNVS